MRFKIIAEWIGTNARKGYPNDMLDGTRQVEVIEASVLAEAIEKSVWATKYHPGWHTPTRLVWEYADQDEPIGLKPIETFGLI